MFHACSNLNLLLIDPSWAKFSSEESQSITKSGSLEQGETGNKLAQGKRGSSFIQNLLGFFGWGQPEAAQSTWTGAGQAGVKAVIYQQVGLGQTTQDLLSSISLSIRVGGYPLYLSPGF